VDPSQGTHFFQNMTSFNVGYVNVDNFARPGDVFREEQLNDLPAVEETEMLRHITLNEDITILIDGAQSHAMIKIK
jgi:hypothetical protein